MRGQVSHKCTDESVNPILQFYYKRVCSYMPIICIHVVVIWHTSLQHVLTPLCIGNELFFTSVYLLYFHSGPGNNIFSVAYINIQLLLMFYSSASTWIWSMVACSVWLNADIHHQTDDQCCSTCWCYPKNCQYG